MIFLAIILIIIGVIKLYLATTIDKYDIYSITSLPIDYDFLSSVIAFIIGSDGLIEFLTGLFILTL